MSLFILFISFCAFSLSVTGCAQKEIVTKYKYIEKPVPKLQTINLNELNLSKDKSIKLHIKVKKVKKVEDGKESR